MGVDKSAYGPNGEYRGTGGGGGVTGAFGELVDFYQPSHQYLTQERERMRLDIVQRPSTADPNGEIDLDSGVVTVSVEPEQQPRH